MVEIFIDPVLTLSCPSTSVSCPCRLMVSSTDFRFHNPLNTITPSSAASTVAWRRTWIHFASSSWDSCNRNEQQEEIVNMGVTSIQIWLLCRQRSFFFFFAYQRPYNKDNKKLYLYLFTTCHIDTTHCKSYMGMNMLCWRCESLQKMSRFFKYF